MFDGTYALFGRLALIRAREHLRGLLLRNPGGFPFARLAWTGHALQRAAERGLACAVAELAYFEGEPRRADPASYVLTKAAAAGLLGKGYDRVLVAHAIQAAPFVAVVRDRHVVTVFKLQPAPKVHARGAVAPQRRPT